jgi:hypothetical protein
LFSTLGWLIHPAVLVLVVLEFVIFDNDDEDDDRQGTIFSGFKMEGKQGRRSPMKMLSIGDQSWQRNHKGSGSNTRDVARLGRVA